MSSLRAHPPGLRAHPPGRALQHCGFTLIELLVLIAILGILTSLLLSAIGRARTAARRTQCLNNLRQLGTAATLHHDAKGAFPYTMSGFDGRLKRNWSISPHAFLLPYLEQDPVYQEIDLSDETLDIPGGPPQSQKNSEALQTPVPIFRCPAEPYVPFPGATNYRASMGIGPALHGGQGWEYGNGSGAFRFGRAGRHAEVRDGLEYTALFSEKLVGDGDPGPFTPWKDYFYYQGTVQTIAEAEQKCYVPAGANPSHDSYPGTSWLFGGYRQTWYNHVFGPNSSRPDCGDANTVGGGYGAFSARSFHPEGVNVVMAGGSARFVAEQIDLRTWRSLATRAHGDIVSDSF